MRLLLLFLALQACEAQQELPPDLLLLAKIKVKMAENLDRLPNYTCEQTIERSRRRAPARKFELLDTVRLEVALVENRELYGWPGANRITESDLSNLVGGTIGNGDFGLLARMGADQARAFDFQHVLTEVKEEVLHTLFGFLQVSVEPVTYVRAAQKWP